MRVSFSAATVVLAALSVSSCSVVQQVNQPPVVKADQPFSAAGTIEMQMESGEYTVRAASDARIRVSFAGNTGNAVAELKIDGTHANLVVRDTPHNNFRAMIEVPQVSDVSLHLTAGNLEMGAIQGSKSIDSRAGNVEIAVPNRDDYGTVDASVTAGDLHGGPFGGSGSGLTPHLSWSGPGKYRLDASLGAGNLEFRQ